VELQRAHDLLLGEVPGSETDELRERLAIAGAVLCLPNCWRCGGFQTASEPPDPGPTEPPEGDEPEGVG